MKQTLSFHSPIIASTQSKVDVEAFEKSTDAFEKGEHLQSFYLLLDYIDPELRSKFGNAEGTEFAVPHGSIMVYLRLEGDQLNITAPFLLLPEKGRIPLLRQVAALNLTELTLACRMISCSLTFIVRWLYAILTRYTMCLRKSAG